MIGAAIVAGFRGGLIVAVKAKLLLGIVKLLLRKLQLVSDLLLLLEVLMV